MNSSLVPDGCGPTFSTRTVAPDVVELNHGSAHDGVVRSRPANPRNPEGGPGAVKITALLSPVISSQGPLGPVSVSAPVPGVVVSAPSATVSGTSVSVTAVS